MNKIVVDKEKDITINNNVVALEIFKEELTINVIGKVLINDLTTTSKELVVTINLAKDSTLVYNNFTKGEINNKIIINQEENSNLTYNYSLLVTNKSSINITSNIKGSNNNCEINVKAVTQEKGSLEITATGNIIKNIVNNKYIENIRILTLNNEENTIIPNLLVSSNNIEALHNATISSINKDELFYLNSKGLSERNAKELIVKGYLINNLELSEEDKELIINEI